MTIPSLSMLSDAIHQTFHLRDARGGTTTARLQSTRNGMRMNERCACYAAVFVLPMGIHVTQGTYQIQHPDGKCWDLFLVPIAPTESGQNRLEAVFHYELETSLATLAGEV